MKKIQPFIWFNDNAEEAMEFYIKLFADSRIVKITRLGENVPGPKGKQLVGEFELMGQTFLCINGGPNPMLQSAGPISFTVPCDTQEEIDKLWDAFKEGGKEIACGWIADRFGVTWQVVPSMMGQWMGDPDPEKAKRTAAAMMQMMKFDIAALKAAHDGV
jgi:predicted 3-demethylubiquinone-9 3-methyltransferase (glyoxalase superfamily)